MRHLKNSFSTVFDCFWRQEYPKIKYQAIASIEKPGIFENNAMKPAKKPVIFYHPEAHKI